MVSPQLVLLIYVIIINFYDHDSYMIDMEFYWNDLTHLDHVDGIRMGTGGYSNTLVVPIPTVPNSYPWQLLPIIVLTCTHTISYVPLPISFNIIYNSPCIPEKDLT